MFTKVNSNGRNVLHMACHAGSLDMLHFLLEKAGPSYLDCVQDFVNTKDEMGLPPLYLLCQRGFRVKNKKRGPKESEEKVSYGEHK